MDLKRSRLQNGFQYLRGGAGFLPRSIQPKRAPLGFIDSFAYSFRADLAMRGSAISNLTRACVAFLSSFLAFFRDMLPMMPSRPGLFCSIWR